MESKSNTEKTVQIVDYEKKYAQAFRDINVEWISHYFEMEAADYLALDNPDTYIIDKGGYIFVALLEGEPVGVVAMLKMDTEGYELAKMGVSAAARGRGVGLKLGEAVIDRARTLGAKRLYLESNTILTPALRLYYKLGFEKLTSRLPSPYARSNIQMELWLDS